MLLPDRKSLNRVKNLLKVWCGSALYVSDFRMRKRSRRICLFRLSILVQNVGSLLRFFDDREFVCPVLLHQ